MNRKLYAGAALALLLGSLAGCSKPQAHAASGESAPSTTALTVEAASLQTQDWPLLVQASGQITAWQEVIVAPETGGLQLAEIKADVGMRVKRGQILARLSDESLHNDERKQVAAVAQASANLEQAQSNLRRARQAEGSGALSAQKIDDYRIAADTAKASLDSVQADLASTRLKLAQTRVVAVDDGVVSSKSAVLGGVVNAGTELFRLVRQGRVEWRPELDAQQLDGVTPGRIAHLTLPGGQQVQGAVRTVGPTLAAGTGRATAYIELAPDGPARAGMFASGTLELDRKPANTLPASAIVLRDGRSTVYLIGAGAVVTSRPVITGRQRGNRVEVVSGLEAGAKVVASGGAFLSDGAHVAVVGPPAATSSPDVARSAR